jgi:hypothetical protein
MTTCPDCDREMFGDRCQCGYVAKAVKSDWIVRYCETPGCQVRIRERLGTHSEPTCQWCQGGKAYQPSKGCKVCGGTNGHQYPDCWFWLEDAERQRRFALPYWQERIKAAGLAQKEAV